MTDLFKATDTSQDLEALDGDNPLEQLVGPGKRYADINALAKAAGHQLPYIKRLEEENEAQRMELQKRLSIEEYTNQLRADLVRNQENVQNRVPSQRTHESSSQDEKRPDPLDFNVDNLKKELFTEFETRLTSQQKKAQAERNVEAVRSELQKTWGNTYAAELKSRAQELNLSEEFLGKLAEENPQGFLKIVGASQAKSPPQSIPTNSRNSAYRSDTPQTTDRTKSYYDKLKKDNPKLYWTKQIQAQEHRDMIRIGEAFFNS